MDERQELLGQLESHYRRQGWPVRRDGDGTLLAAGPGGVIWHGVAVVDEDLASDNLLQRLAGLSERRMPDGGELCPLDLLAPLRCEERVRSLLDGIGLGERPHISLYSLAT